MTISDELQFEPVGSHADGDTISSATALTKPSGAKKLMIQALEQNVRYTLDGTDPTTSKGFVITAGNDPYILFVHPNTTVTVIQEAATADLQYQWGK